MLLKVTNSMSNVNKICETPAKVVTSRIYCIHTSFVTLLSTKAQLTDTTYPSASNITSEGDLVITL